MSAVDMEKIPEFLLQLTDGLSIHIKSASRYWMALALISVITIISTITIQPSTYKHEENATDPSIALPFSLGKIDKTQFYPFSAALISILIISFGSSQAQMIRTRKLINSVLRENNNDTNLPGGIDLRDAFDSISASSINRTVPIAQLLLGEHQFYPAKDNQPKARKVFAVIYQVALKLVSYLVVYLLPAYALYVSFIFGELFCVSNNVFGLPVYFIWFVSLMSMAILFQLLLLELLYAINTVQRIFGWVHE
jgi:hypothetical protein